MSKTKSTAKAKRKSTPEASSHEIDRYLEGLPEDQRAALQKLRETIQAAVPTAEECISYQRPAFRLDGKVLVLFGAATRHCTFYPGSGTAVEVHRDELKNFKSSKGAIQFLPDVPLPARLVRTILKYRIAENSTGKPRAPRRAVR